MGGRRAQCLEEVRTSGGAQGHATTPRQLAGNPTSTSLLCRGQHIRLQRQVRRRHPSKTKIHKQTQLSSRRQSTKTRHHKRRPTQRRNNRRRSTLQLSSNQNTKQRLHNRQPIRPYHHRPCRHSNRLQHRWEWLLNLINPRKHPIHHNPRRQQHDRLPKREYSSRHSTRRRLHHHLYTLLLCIRRRSSTNNNQYNRHTNLSKNRQA